MAFVNLKPGPCFPHAGGDGVLASSSQRPNLSLWPGRARQFDPPSCPSHPPGPPSQWHHPGIRRVRVNLVSQRLLKACDLCGVRSAGIRTNLPFASLAPPAARPDNSPRISRRRPIWPAG